MSISERIYFALGVTIGGTIVLWTDWDWVMAFLVCFFIACLYVDIKENPNGVRPK